ncbi:MAG: hypothetical protein WCV92_00170 [Candidatus Buchananbacteria bacterium]
MLKVPLTNSDQQRKIAMSKSRGQKTGPERGMRKLGLAPGTILSAQQVIDSLRPDLGTKTKAVIHLLSQKAMTITELIMALRRDRKIPSGLSHEKLVRLLHDLVLNSRTHIFRQRHGLWYVRFTAADPMLQKTLERKRKPVDRHIMVGRFALRAIIFDILQEGPLVLGEIMERVRNHQSFNEPEIDEKQLRIDVWNVVARNEELFVKVPDATGHIPTRNTRWGLRSGAELPTPKKLRLKVTKKRSEYKRPKHTPHQRDALYTIMRAQRIIAGWTYDELCNAIIDPSSGYVVDQTKNKEGLKNDVCCHLTHPNDRRFGKVRRGVWRALHEGPSRPPQSVEDFRSLIEAIIKDLGHTLSFTQLISSVRRYGFYFGWDTLSLPDAFMQRNVLEVLRSIDATKIDKFNFDSAIDKILATRSADDNDRKSRGSARRDHEDIEDLLAGIELPTLED